MSVALKRPKKKILKSANAKLYIRFSIPWWEKKKKKKYLSKFNFSNRERIISRSSSSLQRFESIEIFILQNLVLGMLNT